ncbi:MAG TPA: helix-turn-helix domain-containing protein [archaeon]|nr:helix-turn-helix domain-containing protein [archaeon]
MLDSIKKFGLNEYEAKAYGALLKTGKGSAVSVSKGAGIPRARVYDVLVSLEKKGFVVKSASKPIEFTVVTPLKVFNAVAGRKKKELETSLAEVETIASALEKSVSFSGSEESESAWIIEGRHNIYSKIGEQLDNCKEAVVISSSEQGLKRKRGFFEKKLSSLTERGVKVSLKSRSDSRFMVFDKKAAVLFLHPENVSENSEKALFIQSPFVASFFAQNFKK